MKISDVNKLERDPMVNQMAVMLVERYGSNADLFCLFLRQKVVDINYRNSLIESKVCSFIEMNPKGVTRTQIHRYMGNKVTARTLNQMLVGMVTNKKIDQSARGRGAVYRPII